MLFKKLKISFYTCCLSIILMIVPINAIDVLIGGESVGIILNNYFEINDIITSVEKKNVKTIDDLTNIIKNCNTSNLEFTIKRASNIYHKTMKIYKNNAEFSTGLYVKDCAKGIGTVTYYQLNTGKFACLGHNMVDDDLDINDGSLYSASIKGIKKTESYNIG